MDIPWESNVTMGKSFSFAYDDEYKSPRELIHLLIDVIAKGGNLALNVGPQPDGRLPSPAIERMKAIGKWLKVYGEAVYATRVCAPYKTGKFAFTQSKKEKKAFAFYMHCENAECPKEIVIPSVDKKIKYIEDMQTGEKLVFEISERGYILKQPFNNDSGDALIAGVYSLYYA
jgi:alpha-L-fucosidase